MAQTRVSRKFNRCVKSVRKTVKARKGSTKESAAIAICTTTMLHPRGRTLKRYSKGRLVTQKRKMRGGVTDEELRYMDKHMQVPGQSKPVLKPHWATKTPTEEDLKARQMDMYTQGPGGPVLKPHWVSQYTPPPKPAASTPAAPKPVPAPIAMASVTSTKEPPMEAIMDGIKLAFEKAIGEDILDSAEPEELLKRATPPNYTGAWPKIVFKATAAEVATIVGELEQMTAKMGIGTSEPIRAAIKTLSGSRASKQDASMMQMLGSAASHAVLYDLLAELKLSKTPKSLFQKLKAKLTPNLNGLAQLIIEQGFKF